MAVPHHALPQKVVLDEDLLFSDANNDVVCEDRRAAPIRMLLAGAPAIAPVRPHDIHNNTRRMCGGRRNLGGSLLRRLARLRCDGVGRRNGRRRALRTDDGAAHRALNRSAPIFGISASAALPEAARGGLHGGGVV